MLYPPKPEDNPNLLRIIEQYLTKGIGNSALTVKPEFPESLQQTDVWGGITDPFKHDPSKFRYLVHGLNSMGLMTKVASLGITREDGSKADKDWGDQGINLFSEPERLGERVSLSMSLIDEKHTTTWGNGGLIIEAHQENIVAASPSDTGTHNADLDSVLERTSKHNVMDSESLLSLTGPYGYNEVVAVAKTGRHPLELKGFFIRTTASGEPMDRILAEQMTSHANRLGLPLVTIATEANYIKDKVDKTDGKLAVEFNGNRYLFDGFGKSEFVAFNGQNLSSYFPSPQEIKNAIEFAVSSGEIDSERGSSILRAYSEADLQRQTPTVHFDKDGNVENITYRKNYGNNEEESKITKAGYTRRTNLAKEREAMGRIGFGGIIMHSYDNGEDKFGAISPPEGDSMVAKACGTLDAITAEKVRNWYAENRNTLVKQWESHQQRQPINSFQYQTIQSKFGN